MSFLFKEIATAYKNVYKGVNVGKKYKEPKIYHGGANFDLSKRWYVYYSFLDPDTGKLKRQTPITIGVNKDYKTKKERLKYLEFVKEELLKALKKRLVSL